MTTLPTLTLSPAWEVSTPSEIPYDEVDLGNGYRSRVSMTLDITTNWNIRRLGLTTAEKDQLVSELSLYTGVDAFLWSPHPDMPAKAYFCQSWDVTPLSPDNWQISAVFEEDRLGGNSEFADLLNEQDINAMLVGSLQWLQTYTRDVLPLAANSQYITVNAFHNVLGRGGYFPGSAGTTEGQAALGRACMEAFFVTDDVAWKNYAIAIGDALIDFYYNDPVPDAGDEFNTIWLSHWLINVKEAFVSRGPQATVDPLNYGDFEREINFTSGVGVIPSGAPANGDLLAVLYKVYSTDGTLLWQNVNSPLVEGTEYAFDYYVSNFQLKGQNYKIYPDTEASGGTPPTPTAEVAGAIVLSTAFTGTAKVVYSTYTGPTIAIGELFEPYPMWRPLL